jgi:ABC-2 type transport system ATP-binding protein
MLLITTNADCNLPKCSATNICQRCKAMITFKKFQKTYNTNIVLSMDDLRIPIGTHWIKGENGSGKTTLFKSLAGLLPYEGDIIFDDGISAKKKPTHFRRLVNYSEAEPLYPGFLTAKDLIRFIGKTKGADSVQQNSLIEHFRISRFLNNACQTYSSGMLKKVSLVLAFLGKPRIIILDEPLITLDEEARNLLYDIIQKTILENSTSFFISSHQPLQNVVKNIYTYNIENKTMISA